MQSNKNSSFMPPKVALFFKEIVCSRHSVTQVPVSIRRHVEKQFLSGKVLARHSFPEECSRPKALSNQW
jgi:hypothetical protein